MRGEVRSTDPITLKTCDMWRSLELTQNMFWGFLGFEHKENKPKDYDHCQPAAPPLGWTAVKDSMFF